MTLNVDSIRDAMESGVPSTIATCAADGTPNVTFVSQVEYVDPQHVALMRRQRAIVAQHDGGRSVPGDDVPDRCPDECGARVQNIEHAL